MAAQVFLAALHRYAALASLHSTPSNKRSAQRTFLLRCLSRKFESTKDATVHITLTFRRSINCQILTSLSFRPNLMTYWTGILALYALVSEPTNIMEAVSSYVVPSQGSTIKPVRFFIIPTVSTIPSETRFWRQHFAPVREHAASSSQLGANCELDISVMSSGA